MCNDPGKVKRIAMASPPSASIRSQISPQTLQILLAIEEHGSFARAAQQVNLVPSAVSRRVQELEQSLGAQLLRRTAHAVEFTAAGRSVLARARAILNEMDALADELAAFTEGTRGSVRFAGSVFSLMHQLPSELASFRREFPQVALEFQSRSSGQVVQMLLRDEIDVGIFAATEVPTGISAKVYDEDTLILLVPEHHALAGRASVTLADIAGFDLVSSPQGTETRQLIADQARRRGLRLHSSIEVGSLDATVLMVRAGLGVAIVPSRAWEALGPFRGLARVPIGERWAHRQLLVGMASATFMATPAGRLFSRLAERASRPVDVAPRSGTTPPA
jgi:DNA-binding transcriptional LysR family regulator